MSPDGGVLDVKVEEPWYYQGGNDLLIAHSAGKSSPIFRAQVAFPLRESADYAIIGLLLKIAFFAATCENLEITGFQAHEPIAQ